MPIVKNRSLLRKLLSLITGVLALFIVSAVALTVWALEGPLYQPLCGERPPFVRPLSRDQAVFVARAVYIGRTAEDRPGHELGHWALAIVEHRYWGLPWWSSKFVLLSNGGFEKGVEYFVDGDRSRLVSHVVPLIEIGTCSRSAPLKRADIDLLVLQDGPPKAGVRVIGRVVHQRPGSPAAAGVSVEIRGPRGLAVSTTNERGIYDVKLLPPGHYSISVTAADQPDWLPQNFHYEHDLQSGDVWGRTLAVK